MFFPIHANPCKEFFVLANSQSKSYKKNVLYKVKEIMRIIPKN